MNTYARISNIGPNEPSPVDNPLTYCVDNKLENLFLHGGESNTLSKNSKPCQIFLADYCSDKWDDWCTLASQNMERSYPNAYPGNDAPREVNGLPITQGQMLIYNSAMAKYSVKDQGRKVSMPFASNVPTSPMISYWEPNSNSSFSFEVDPANIDQDVLMDRLLMNPNVAPNILFNIFNTMKRKGTLSNLHGTKLGRFYDIVPIFKSLGGLGNGSK